ncbi:MAG: glycosyl hydrolase family 28 protein [Tepidisphaeraceae bacterium]
MFLRFGKSSKGEVSARANKKHKGSARSFGMLETLESRQYLSGTFLITSYGASTSSSDNSAAIEAALTAANKAGGGTVEVPAGTFLSKSITTNYNNITLEIASGGVLEAVAMSNYGSYENKFIQFNDDSNVAITGPGTINGNGAGWWSSSDRPTLIGFNKCNGVTVSNVTMVNSPKEFITFDATNNVVCNHVTISAPSTSPNTDGIDPCGSNYVIENCNISTGDDDIAIKAADAASNNITVTNCTFGTGHGLSIGAQTNDGVNGVTVSNCTFNGTQYGIRLKASEGNGGLVQNCSYTNITMTDVETPIEITSWYDSNPSDPKTVASTTPDSTTPIWKGITITNLTATGATHAGDIYGMPEEPVGAITLSNVNIKAKTGLYIYYASDVTFTKGSVITASSGPDVQTWDATVSGITTTLY